MNKSIGLTAVGSYAPEQILTNADLEKMVETNEHWIISRTGIKERRIAGAKLLASDLAVEAARDCLKGVELKPDLLVASTATAETRFPYQASVVANRLQLFGLPAFDINAACSGLVYSMIVTYSLMQAGPYRNGLIVAGEKMSQFIDYTDRSTCVIFGDAGAALLLSAERPEHLILEFEMGTDASGFDQIVMGGAEHNYYFRQDGKNVYKFAVNKIAEVIDSLQSKTGVRDHDRIHVILHQANSRIIEAGAERTGIPNERFVRNIHKYGNTSSASVGLALKESCEEGRFRKGDVIFLIGFGAGLSWAGLALEW
jgi:3-oxoacyl-[acyl-carrier-protein] synthase-3